MKKINSQKYGAVLMKEREPDLGGGAEVTFADKSGFIIQDETAATGRYKIGHYSAADAKRPSFAERFLKQLETTTKANDGKIALKGLDELDIMAAALDIARQSRRAMERQAKEAGGEEPEEPFDWSTAGVNRRRARRA